MFSIRRATEADADAIAQLSATLGYATPPDQMRRRLAAILTLDADLVIVAVDSTGAVIGWLQGHAAAIIESGFRVEITGLIVSPQRRRSGIGRALVVEAERWAITKGASVIVVRSNVQRLESHAFYPALGYTPSKQQTVYRKVLELGDAKTE